MRGDILIYIQSILLPGTCVITYFISTSNDHVAKEFPYVSDTGNLPPESCIFGILLSLFSLTTFLSIYVKWRIIQRLPDQLPSTYRVNHASLIMGISAAFGVLLVAHFQVSNQLIVHMIGAFFAFIIGNLYMWLQTFLSYRAVTVRGSSRILAHIRLIMCLVTSLAAILTVILGFVSMRKLPPGVTVQKWMSNHEGWDLHVGSTSMEWVMVGIVSLFFLTFAPELRHVTVGLPEVISLSEVKSQPFGIENANMRDLQRSAEEGEG